MFLVGIMSWWYGNGFIDRIQIVKNRLSSTIDLFSVGILLKTLFSPYKQISASGVGNSLGESLQAFSDKTISRFVGFFTRLTVLIIGMVVIIFQIIISFFILLFWIIIPFLPAVGLIMTLIGWVPKWII